MRERQAVVLIHGIGEPRPMAMLRAFVAGILSGEEGLGAQMRSKPDRLSESYELRRLVASANRRRPATDFFEFYWAHHMEGNTLRHVWPLARLLLLRWPWRVPKALFVLWAISWAAVASAIYMLAQLLTRDPAQGWGSLPLASTVSTLVFGALQVLVSNYLGDAARYLSPVPENVSIRQKIRSQGIDVVKRIQDSNNYDRIVIVGHSLGSVIGYDVITYLWDQCNTEHALVDRPDQTSLRRVEQAGRQLNADAKAEREAYRMLQRDLWREQRALQNPWLITDFVTIGSPLTYAEILFTRDLAELRQRQADREFPTCPPQTDAGRYSYRRNYEFNGAKRSLHVLHHAAPFAVTRWTNLYVPLTAGVLGDWIGGPVQRAFGAGVEDVPIPEGALAYLPLLPHTRYWHRGNATSLNALADALALNSRDWLP